MNGYRNQSFQKSYNVLLQRKFLKQNEKYLIKKCFEKFQLYSFQDISSYFRSCTIRYKSSKKVILTKSSFYIRYVQYTYVMFVCVLVYTYRACGSSKVQFYSWKLNVFAKEPRREDERCETTNETSPESSSSIKVIVSNFFYFQLFFFLFCFIMNFKCEICACVFVFEF